MLHPSLQLFQRQVQPLANLLAERHRPKLHLLTPPLVRLVLLRPAMLQVQVTATRMRTRLTMPMPWLQLLLTWTHIELAAEQVELLEVEAEEKQSIFRVRCLAWLSRLGRARRRA